ncbi:DUF805 domain-containing protein [Sulfitobacter sp. M57]|uniref:DUF805 domain-containing protein n=1 Tax=unclassified Sulfitobacter TaxID=196795 RepID=UPI0023E0B018|nr:MULTISPECIES: DUF805 domain-containing protein [unclassified Sulfitobacter]MDF3412854.1 DUF805 domain-containing protein [Sulfitobacter sp. KE5]MDF3421862.1 DUF805 domain-containing protein [Sulfitobacter sp. KE43]MDF3431403.1 DUF805 domain-containing protein [Sulfitobacter sp. KE42]MDF3457044.1 DUF805 domain-containing protein [Sulfitobacter sp. S74]MDF3460947.1 DUF805 domain-containing protein [Sulfitobacter sp. Ks18]
MTMDFPTAVRTCLTQKYATFQGRASRSEYWWFFLVVLIGAVVTQLIWGLLYLIYTLAIICPALAAGFRRLQDTGRPGWYIVIPFGISLLASLMAPDVPTEEAMAAGQMPDFANLALFSILAIVQLIISLVFLWWLTRPSQPETNAYGPPPTPQT